MPGIAGIISKANNRSFERDIEIMQGCMMHESFYSSVKYVNRNIGLYVSWVGIKDSFTDCMPLWNEKKDSCLFFSGEEFSDKHTIEQLKYREHVFDPLNASYIIHFYEEKGEEFIEHLNGRFNGVLFDLSNEKIIIFNDRYGMQRFFFKESNEAFYFSSEVKSLLKIKTELRNLDYHGLGEFISFGCVLENRTLFQNIFLLPCGSKWTFYNGCNMRKEQYFKPSYWENKPILDMDIYYEKLKDTFERILPKYFRSRESIGISLTGGLDTRMIMAFRDLKPGQIPCYTFGGMFRESTDVRIARKVAHTCHQTYQIIRIGKEFLSNFHMFAEKTIYITDGCLDVSGSPELYANRLARDIAPIRMTGNYGSEVLRGNVAFKPNTPCESLFNIDFYKQIQNARNTYSEIKKGHPLSFIVFKQAPWHHYSRYALEQSQLTIRSPFLDNDLVGLVYQAPQDAINGDAFSLRLINNGNPRLSEIMTDRGIGGKSSLLFLTIARIFQEFTFKAEYAYDYGMPQWVAKLDHIFKSLHIERLFLGRHKFCHFRIWYRNELSDYVRDILLDRRTMNRQYLNKDFLTRMVGDHLHGNFNYTTEIHKILTIELIHRLFIDQ